MRVPLQWLREMIDVKLPISELAERLTLGGLEVTAIDHVGEWWDREKLLVGEVLGVREHPNADRLVLARVRLGADEELEVVTGAPNLPIGSKGQKVAFAKSGTRLIDGYAEEERWITLKPAKIRGVRSEGMVCSEKELGLSDSHEGIIILPDDAPVGRPMVDYWGDTVLDLDLTPNLARCFSVLGVARDAAALTDVPLRWAPPEMVVEGSPIDGQVEVEIADPDLCPRYAAALVAGVTIGPSPAWMQRRLVLAGMRPINNVVDITNYVMLELGQPLHAFDYAKLRPAIPGGPPTIIVRRAQDGERMSTLDGVERKLSTETLLITDGGGPVAIAGVMGGLESEVTDATVDVLIEAATFDNISIRRTSANLRLASESAQRFGRGVDRELPPVALQRAADLMRQFAGGTIAEGFVDVYPRPYEPVKIDLTTLEVERLLGISLTPQRIAGMLSRLGFACIAQESVVQVTVPSFRFDVTLPADLVEEVARVYGYDRLPTTLMAEETPGHLRNRTLMAEERVRDILAACGLTEVITYSLTNLESVAKLDPAGDRPDAKAYIRLANTLTREQEYMRRTLMNGLLETAARNLRFVDRVWLFEIGAVFLPQEGAELPDEPLRLGLLLTGRRDTSSWLTQEAPMADLYDLKGIIEQLADRLGIDDLRFEACERGTFHPGRTAILHCQDEYVGVMGQVDPRVCDAFDLPEQPVLLAELELDALLAHAEMTPTLEPISPMPPLREDLAFVVDQAVGADEVEAAIREAAGPLLADVSLFDVYRGEQAGAGKISLAYRLTLQAPDRTLTSKESERVRSRIVKAIAQNLGGELRT
jgi:phenylalanyl-tRNA synthetase beta chain